MHGYHTVRCLFCTAGKEESVAQTVRRNGWGHAIFPRRACLVRSGSQWTETLKPLLPGYVFVYSGTGQAQYAELAAIRHVIRVLSYEPGCDALTGTDLAFADWLWRNHGEIRAMKALRIGDWIEITDGLFKELHGTIVRMDRRRRFFLVSLEGTGVIRQIWLSYEVVEKREADHRETGASVNPHMTDRSAEKVSSKSKRNAKKKSSP